MDKKRIALTIVVAVATCMVVGPVNVFKGVCFLAIVYWVYTIATGGKVELNSVTDKLSSFFESHHKE